jgi:tetratricopeptide (TPR) repeat protein
LGLAEAAVPASVEEAAARFRSMTSGRRVLVVLDNARDAGQVRLLIPGGLGCGVIITCRRTLAPVGGVVHRGLDVLSEQEAGLLLSRLVGPQRIEAEPEALAGVVRLCGGLPLALCIVAARLASRPAWSVAAMRDRLGSEQHRLAELQMGDRAIRASFEVSYRDLARDGDGADAARLFRLLGVFDCMDVGPEAAAALAGLSVGRADGLLERLTEGRLVETFGSGRYRMHDLLRLYARECAETFDTEPVTAAAVHRVLHFYLATGRAATLLLNPAARWRTELGPRHEGGRGIALPDRDEAHAWVDAEAANLAAVVHQAASRDDDLTIALAAALTYPLYVRGHWRQELVLSEIAVETAERMGDPEYKAFAYVNLGTARSQLGRPAEAQPCFERALGHYRQIGNLRRAAVVLNHTGTVYRKMGMLEQAIERHLQALDIHRAHADRCNEGMTLTNLALAYQRAKRLGEARDAQHQAVAALRAEHARRPPAGVIGKLAETHRVAGDPAMAVECFREALALDRGDGHRGSYGEAERLWGLGRAYHDLDRADEARKCWHESADVLQRLGLISPEDKRVIQTSAVPRTPDVIERQL